MKKKKCEKKKGRKKGGKKGECKRVEEKMGECKRWGVQKMEVCKKRCEQML